MFWLKEPRTNSTCVTYFIYKSLSCLRSHKILANKALKPIAAPVALLGLSFSFDANERMK